MKTIQAINQKVHEMNEMLNKECGLFWAFSKEQFKENKTPLKEGEKYVSIGHGGYLPKSNLDKLVEGWDAIKKWRDQQIKFLKDAPSAILYEINNRECFFSGDLRDIYELFEGIYTQEFIDEVYKNNYHTFNF